MSEPWQTILTLAAGVATGVLSGMFGVGGAVVSTPAIRVLGATPLEAIGSTIPSIDPVGGQRLPALPARGADHRPGRVLDAGRRSRRHRRRRAAHGHGPGRTAISS